jgi:hypothetical protein
MTVRDAALFLILRACEEFGSTGFQPVIFFDRKHGLEARATKNSQALGTPATSAQLGTAII